MKLNNKKRIFLIVSCVLVIVGLFGFFNFNKTSKIERVLKTEYYAYLPKEAQNYIKEIYEETGEVILTEKNKKSNELYLNPQYVEYLTYSEEEKEQIGDIPVSMIIDYSIRDEAKNITVPSKYDMRGSFVTPVRDQGKLGVCWTFATAGVTESYLLQNDQQITIESPKLISERQIDYVTSRNGIKDYKSEYVSFINRSLGDGGNFYISTIAMANGVSLFNSSSFKEYDDTDLSKMELSDVINFEKSEYEVNSTINFPRNNLRESTSILTEEEKETRDSYLKEVKQNIMTNGGAYVGTYMDSSCQYTDANLNNLVIDVYNCSAQSGHAMQIIGWDDDLEYSYCADTKSHNAVTSKCTNVIKGKGVWILKNSWGDELQHPYLTYDSLYSSIHFIDEMTSSDERTWDNNYILGDGVENVNEKLYYLNDTKIKDDEKIEKVKFIAENPDTIYNVKIYKKDGTYETFSKKSDLPGLITIEITEEIVVNKDSKIIISSENSYIDRISIFTSNIDTEPYIDLSNYDNMEINETQIRLYSETKNIPSSETLIYELYDSNNQKIIDGITFSNNTVAENNINTLVKFSNALSSGNYKINAIYNSNIIASTNIKIVKMVGDGTKDNPYIITNSAQLNQIRDDLDAYYELANDIDLSEDTREGGKLSLDSSTCPQGFGWESINGFSGTLDGKGHTIKGLYQNNYLTCNIDGDHWREWNMYGNGLFWSAHGDVTIKNLVLEDFEVNCTETKDTRLNSCGALLSVYSAHNFDLQDQNEYNANFENLVIRNSKTENVGGRDVYGGGLFGRLENYQGNITFSNIYLDFEPKSNGFKQPAYLASYIGGKSVDVNNILIKGNIDGKYEDGSGNAVLINKYLGVQNATTKNVLSTVTGKNVGGLLYNDGYTGTIDGVNILSIEERPLCRAGCSNKSNVNIFNKDLDLYKLTDKSNYSSWNNFDDNWVIETVDGIPRLPVLKFVDFEYTNIDDIIINQELNKHSKIYDYIEPNIDSAKRIVYSSNNEDIVKIDENGTIIPQSSGETTIHIESYYDGYINDVPITIDYQPHYTIHFDSNDTEDYYKDIQGTMESIEVAAGESFTLPANKFTQEYYEFKEWNTEADGTGISYSDLSEIPAMNDKDEITLYVQWWGKERIVNFDANGGTVSPDRKVVRIRSEYGELPIPSRAGYGFNGWHDLKGANYTDAFTTLSGLELTANWEDDSYTIIYDANGGTIKEEYKDNHAVYLISDTLATTYAKNNQNKGIFENLYEKSGHEFKEWNTEADGTGTSYTVDDTILLNNVENDTLRLYAIWEDQEYSIIFDANEGKFEDNKTTFVIENWDDSKLESLEIPTRNGYQFKGYYTEKNGGTSLEMYIAEAGIDRDGLIFYAQWEVNKYTLKFNANGGIGTMNDQEFVHDTSQRITKNAYTREGFKFKEWNTKADGTGTVYTNEKEIKLSDDLTLYAIWEETYSYIINKYSYDDNKKYIDKIDINTTVDNFKKNIDLNIGYSIDVNYKIVDNKNLIYTGSKTKIYKNNNLIIEYTNIIRGEVTGDAKINYLDYVNVYNHIQKVKHPELDKKELKNEYLISADMSGDKKVNYLDYVQIYNKIKELKGGN